MMVVMTVDSKAVLMAAGWVSMWAAYLAAS